MKIIKRELMREEFIGVEFDTKNARYDYLYWELGEFECNLKNKIFSSFWRQKYEN